MQSLELEGNAVDDDGHPRRTGTLWSCIAHIITAVVGAGVLSLAWSVAQLGWIAGPVSLLCFAVITCVSAFLLAECYRGLDPITGKRNYSYMEAVGVYMGQKRMIACGLLQFVNLYGTSIAYVITCAASIRIQTVTTKRAATGPVISTSGAYMLFFGGCQIVMSFIPDFHSMMWVSAVAAIMSFAYSFIGLGLGFAKVLENRRVKGGIAGAPATNAQKKLWNVFEALGDIAFAYPYSKILLEIQVNGYLKVPSAENKTMKNASVVATLSITFLYVGCGCFGYAAFGDETPANLLTGFGFFEPYWLVDLANACIVLHLVGGYQVYSQPIFSTSERWIMNNFPDSRFVNGFRSVKLPFLPTLWINLMKFVLRTSYVMSTMGIALVFPYFNSVVGVLGALDFWPLAIYFPVEMYIVQKKITQWTRTWVVLQSFSYICLGITVLGPLGSLEGLVHSE
ncbi:hypothetical protein MLD38_024874 [Melastoma candidum]|uniref:Uncharacterized protein n=1 Tax=Melastoma candidum TaxID=119954 RepID=A0ACB9NWG6_9MYRT|nr:hypothetical protein MLD38_024874 [Melastoma candidum]